MLPAHMAACSALAAAVRRAMGVAAPDWAGLAVKLELLLGYEAEPYSLDEEVLAAVRADLGRLARASGGSG